MRPNQNFINSLKYEPRIGDILATTYTTNVIWANTSYVLDGGVATSSIVPFKFGDIEYSPILSSYLGVQYNAGTVSSAGATVGVSVTTDGVNWSYEYSDNGPEYVKKVIYATNSFYATSEYGYSMRKSATGSSWEKINSSNTRMRDVIYVTYSINKVFASGVCNGRTAYNVPGMISYSSDGYTWATASSVSTPFDFGSNQTVGTIAYSPTLNFFIGSYIGGQAGYYGTHVYSSDGITWTLPWGAAPTYLNSKIVVWLPSLSKFLIAVTDDSQFWFSSDGISLSSIYTYGFTTGGIYSIFWSNTLSKIVMTCVNGIYTSSDALSWTQLVSGNYRAISEIR